MATKSGVELIAEERKRQIEKEGWNTEHDDCHTDGELARAAICYASPELVYIKDEREDALYFLDPWPWDSDYDKRQRKGTKLIANCDLSDNKRIRNLVKAGALITAEIDRLQRQKEKENA